MHASRESLPLQAVGEEYEARLAEFGDYTAYFERIAAGTDFTAFYDSCACPHWGYVFKGRLRFTYDDGTVEDVSAGECYYAPPGHTFVVLEDTETIEFSPTLEYNQHMEKVQKNIEATPAAQS